VGTQQPHHFYVASIQRKIVRLLGGLISTSVINDNELSLGSSVVIRHSEETILAGFKLYVALQRPRIPLIQSQKS
jgi:hypothetical protein